MKVLIVSAGYIPGFRYGGPVRSLAALVDCLGDDIEFSIVTSNRDLGANRPYPGILQNTWTPVGKASVFYTSSETRSPQFWRRIVQQRKPDVIYLNSYFSTESILIRVGLRTRLIERQPFIVAPRGEFSPGALGLKSRKKQIFLKAARIASIDRGAIFQASTALEASEIKQSLGENTHVVIAPNLVEARSFKENPSPKMPNEAKFVFVGRISPKKNLLQAIRLVSQARGRVRFEIFGPVEDESYFASCCKTASDLPENVEFHYGGELLPDAVTMELTKHHFLLFPTLGENFGHSIAEALQAGLPVLVSDQTPWGGVTAAGCGWSLPLDQPSLWRDAIQRCIDMGENEYRSMTRSAGDYFTRWQLEHGGRTENLTMFQEAASSCRL